jgi:hypothetical protein
MTKNKGFKRFIRRRAAATGESYQRTRQRLAEPTDRDVRSEDDRARGRRLADLALRAADGKPVAFAPPPPGLRDLMQAAHRAQREASEPDAPPSLREHAARLSDELAVAVEEANRTAAPISTVDYLARRVQRDDAALAVAMQICREAIERNQRDVVAHDALSLLEQVARATR